MRGRFLISVSCVLVLAAVPALAEEIVHFTNGTTMIIEAHEVDGDNLRVELSGKSFMEFPLDQVSKIETAQGDVVPRPGANRMLPSNAASHRGIVRGAVPSRHRRGQWRSNQPGGSNDGRVGATKSGVAVYRPHGSDKPNMQKIGLTGRRELTHARSSNSARPGLAGTTKLGSRHVLPPKNTSVRPAPVGVSLAKSGNGSGNKKKD